jgi:MFS family permease
MVRIILGVIAGFIAWSILWVGSDAVFSAISADWGKTSTEFQEAVARQTPYTLSSTVLIALLVKSFIVSLISGFITALIARENTKSTFVLGVLLLLFGVFVQVGHWNYMPLWYHIPFLILLIPMTVLGGQLKKQSPMA